MVAWRLTRNRMTRQWNCCLPYGSNPPVSETVDAPHPSHSTSICAAASARVRFPLSGLCLLAGTTLALPAFAEVPEPSGAVEDLLHKDLKISVGGTVTHNSNQFLSPKSVNPLSETLTATNIGLALDKTYSRQRFKLDLTQSVNRYAKSSRLNFDSLNYQGAWQWQITSRLSGSLSASRRESLVPFEVDGGTVRNLSVSENRSFKIDASNLGNWHLLAGLSQSDQKSEQAVRLQPDFRSTSADYGIKYQTPNGFSVTATRRETLGQYLNVPVGVGSVDNGFSQQDSELNASWAPSAKSTLTAGISWQSRENNNPTQRNFAGPAANISYGWKPTSRLGLNIAASRKIGPLQDPSFSTVTTDSVSLAPTFQISDKVTVRAGISYVATRFGGSGTVPPSVAARRDALNSASLGISWVPTRTVTLGANLQHQRRSANDPLLEFENTMASVNASLTF